MPIQTRKKSPRTQSGGLGPFLCSKSIKNAQNHRFLANFGLLGPKLTKMTLKTPKNGSFWSKKGSRPLRDPIFGVLGQKNRQNHQNFDFFWVFFCLTEGVFLRKTRTKFVTSKGGALDVHKFDQFWPLRGSKSGKNDPKNPKKRVIFTTFGPLERPKYPP